MLYIILSFVSAAALVLVLSWYYIYSQYEKYLKHFPGVRPLPVIGNALDFRNSRKLVSNSMKYLQMFNGNFKIYIGAQPYLFVSKPAELEFFLSSNTILTKPKPYDYLHNWLGTGLLTAPGSKWKKHRKIITPAFHFQILEDFVDVFNKGSGVLVEKLEKEIGKSSTDIYPYITLCTLDIICESAMGTSVNAQEDKDSNYVKSIHTMLKIIITRSFSPFLQYDFFYNFTGLCQEERAALKVLHNYTKSVISRRRQEFLENNTKDTTADDLGRRKKRAFLDLLLEYSVGGQITDDEIRQEVDTFMFEGHDTTGSAISFTLYCLANNLSVQAKAFEEIKNVFCDDPNRPAIYRDFRDMKYLELVIKESLRMYPPVPFYGRKIDEDVNCNGKILPKGLMINIFSYGLHYDSELYPNPQKFQPERFEPGNMKDKNPYTYLPFSAGPRNCIGQKFAMAEIKAVVSNVLRHFELFPVPDHKIVLNSEVVLKSSNGVLIRLQRRS